MFAWFVISVMAIAAGGTTVDHCQASNLNAKECVQYVRDNLEADYSGFNK